MRLQGRFAERLVLVLGAGRPEVHQELEDGVLGDAGHAARGADAVALDQGGDDLDSLGGG